MSRAILGEYVLEGVLKAESPLAVGSGKPGADLDMTCVRDGLGRLIIPGSTLAGALRQHYGDRPQWGLPPVKSDDPAEKSDTPTWASYLWVDDAPETGAGSGSTEVRDGVAIDRRTGASATGYLFTREVVPRGATFALRLRVEAVAPGETVPGLSRDEAKAWAHDMASRLREGVALGRATTSGLGRVKLTEPKLTWLESGRREGFLAWLEGRPSVEAVGEGVGAAATSPDRLRVTVKWKPLSPLVVTVFSNGLVDAVPQTSGRGTAARLVIPGTSVKGVLRGRAERIVRTLRRADAPEAFADQLADDLPPVDWLFGFGPKPKDGERRPGRRGAALVHEVYSSQTLDWRRIARILERHPSREDRVKERAEAGRKLRQELVRINDHVAVSRWTGGAEDDRLFALAAPDPWVSWDDIVIDVDLARLPRDPRWPDQTRRDAAVMMLILLARDLAEGWIGLGHATTRGYGEVAAAPQDVKFDLGPASFTLDQVWPQDEVAEPYGRYLEAWRRVTGVDRAHDEGGGR
ncbi:MAG: RAMP superfamily CRISPR-associated protein [Propionibacteriaceae bacterium]|jgi:CRISPR/Cas system CSM-associated protein Csm3 (group 7 of RAMP superfamily)|nr:RAMP superfamily CRISPR-associated protein [Propionibacteriaceae bacterium]